MAKDLEGGAGAPSQRKPMKRTSADVRDTLAPSHSEAQLQLLDGTPLSGWLSSPEEFDAAVVDVLKTHARDRVQFEHYLAL